DLDGEGDLDDPPTTAELDDLADNGGPTATRHPASDSPLVGAIPNATCTARSPGPLDVDQRGAPRPATAGGACDIGSVQTAIEPPTEDCGTLFTDVAGSHPFCEEIAWMADRGYANGWPDGT